jgi:hypothetical protein
VAENGGGGLEMICNFDQLCSTLQVICTPPCHTTPIGLPSFPLPPESKQNKTKQNVSLKVMPDNSLPLTAKNPHDLNTYQVKKKHIRVVVKEVV